MKIGELEQMTGVSIETIRYYEKVGILSKPGRTASNYRQYGNQHVDCLKFVRHCRSLDMKLDEIRILLQFRDAPESNCGEVNQLLDEHIRHVSERISALAQLEQDLRKLRRQCQKVQKVKDCGILAEIAQGVNHVESRSKNSHLAGAH